MEYLLIQINFIFNGLFGDAISVYVAGEYMWIWVIGGMKSKGFGEKPVHHKFHMDCPWREPGVSIWNDSSSEYELHCNSSLNWWWISVQLYS